MDIVRYALGLEPTVSTQLDCTTLHLPFDLPASLPSLHQAINLDIALIVPGILGALASAALGQDAYKLAPLANVGSDVIFVALLAAVAYSVGSSALGEFPNKLPFFGRINRENPDQEEEEL